MQFFPNVRCFSEQREGETPYPGFVENVVLHISRPCVFGDAPANNFAKIVEYCAKKGFLCTGMAKGYGALLRNMVA